MKWNKMEIELDNRELDLKLKTLLESIPKDSVSELLSTYYSYVAQQYINDKEYDKLQKLEWLIELHSLLREV